MAKKCNLKLIEELLSVQFIMKLREGYKTDSINFVLYILYYYIAKGLFATIIYLKHSILQDTSRHKKNQGNLRTSPISISECFPKPVILRFA